MYKNIQTKTSGVKNLIKSYEDNVSKGMIYPPETEKLYKFIKADTERGIAISNGNIGKFAVELELYAPRAAIMGEMIKKISDDNLSVDSNGVKGYDDKDLKNKFNNSKRLYSLNNLDEILYDPKILSGVSGEELYVYLKKNNYDVKPLRKGNYKGIEFENGGGFKINWGGDRILQFHPDNRSHHNNAYFKISSGDTGTVRIDLEGNIIE